MIHRFSAVLPVACAGWWLVASMPCVSSLIARPLARPTQPGHTPTGGLDPPAWVRACCCPAAPSQPLSTPCMAAWCLVPMHACMHAWPQARSLRAAALTAWWTWTSRGPGRRWTSTFTGPCTSAKWAPRHPAAAPRSALRRPALPVPPCSAPPCVRAQRGRTPAQSKVLCSMRQEGQATAACWRA